MRLKTLRSQQIDGTTLCLLRVVGGDELVEDLASYFDAAFDHAPIGMAIIGADGRYVRVNDALCGMLGRRRGQLIGERDNEITHPDDRERDVEFAWKILRGELDCIVLEKRFVKPDGSVVWVIANMTYLRDDDGTGIAWVGQWQDVTARRAVEAELRRERDLNAAMLAAMHEGFCLIDHDTVAAGQRRDVRARRLVARGDRRASLAVSVGARGAGRPPGGDPQALARGRPRRDRRLHPAPQGRRAVRRLDHDVARHAGPAASRSATS